MLLIIFEISMIVVIMWLLITQVSIPVYRGTKLFPIFKREEKLKTILSEIKQQNIEKELERKIRKAKEEDAKKSTSPKMSSIFTEDETQ